MRVLLFEIAQKEYIRTNISRFNAAVGNRKELEALRKELSAQTGFATLEQGRHLLFDVEISLGHYHSAYLDAQQTFHQHGDYPSQVRLVLAEALNGHLSNEDVEFVKTNSSYRAFDDGSQLIPNLKSAEKPVAADCACALNNLTRIGPDSFFYRDLAEKLDPKNTVLALDFAEMHETRGESQRALEILDAAMVRATGNIKLLFKQEDAFIRQRMAAKSK